MLIVDEGTAARLVTRHDALAAVERALTAGQLGTGETFPVVIGRGTSDDKRFGVKSGLMTDGALVGLKVGTYWAGNRAHALVNHASTILYLDDRTGLPRALVAGSHLTALRTAAADALGVRCLAREDASVVALVGAGQQAWFELQAVSDVRRLSKVLVWSRNRAAADALAGRIRDELAIDAQAEDLEAAVRAADIVVTVTAARQTLVERAWVRPGTHISAMGADARGKQELDPELVGGARLFADVVEQSLTIGEFEAAATQGLIAASDVTPLGAVILGRLPGRTADHEITIFDSSGMALQDLTIGATALERAVEAGLAHTIDLQGGTSA